MPPAFIRKLASAGDIAGGLSASDHELLLGLCDNTRGFKARRDIIQEGERPDHVLVMIKGWSCRYKVLRDGARQITAYLLPGDLCDAHITLFDAMDHSIAAVTDCQVAFIPRGKMIELSHRPTIVRALWWASLVDEAVLRSWIVNLGRRDAFERIGHLICELHARLRNVGLTDDGHFELPLTQEELADALGLTPVHVNRTLQRLRKEELIRLDQKQLMILNVARLQATVGFDPAYLHLPRKGSAAAVA